MTSTATIDNGMADPYRVWMMPSASPKEVAFLKAELEGILDRPLPFAQRDGSTGLVFFELPLVGKSKEVFEVIEKSSVVEGMSQQYEGWRRDSGCECETIERKH